MAGFHDVFGLYGRPEKYSWDTQDPSSLFFAYPTGMERGVSYNCLSRSLG
jgi:CCR4-NOT transcriptional complex subunit CAF120